MVTTTTTTTTMIPAPIQRRVVSFLDYQTALDFVAAATTTTTTTAAAEEDKLPGGTAEGGGGDQVILSKLDPPYELWYSQVFSGDPVTGDCPKKSERIPVFFGEAATATTILPGDGSSCSTSTASSCSDDQDETKHRHYNINCVSNNNDPGGVHTVSLIGRWKDQGWGERKGRIFVIGTSKTQRRANNTNKEKSDIRQEDQFDGGRVVFKSELSSHTFQPLRIDFSPRQDEDYHLWYVVGGGGGHLLMVDDLNVLTLVYDDKARTTRDTYACLFRKGLITGTGGGSCGTVIDGEDFNELATNHRQDASFFISLLRKICCTIVKIQTTNDKAKDKNDVLIPSPIQSFFNRNGMSFNKSSMNATVSICNFLLQCLHHYALPICGDVKFAFQPSTTLTSMSDTSQIPTVPSGSKEIVLPRFTIMPYTTLEGSTDDNETESAQPCCRVPTIPGLTSKVTLKIKWKLAGERNISSSFLYVVEVPVGNESCVDSARNIWQSPAASHEESDVEMSFVPETDKVYYIFQRVGTIEDDGRLRPSFLRLHIYSISMQLSVLDDKNQSMKRQYEKLSIFGDNGGEARFFGLQLLQAAIECLRFTAHPKSIIDDHDVLCSSIRSYFVRHGLPVGLESLASLHSLVLGLVDFRTPPPKNESQAVMNESTNNASAYERLRLFAVM